MPSAGETLINDYRRFNDQWGSFSNLYPIPFCCTCGTFLAPNTENRHLMTHRHRNLLATNVNGHMLATMRVLYHGDCQDVSDHWYPRVITAIRTARELYDLELRTLELIITSDYGQRL